MRQECLDLRRPHVPGVSLVVMQHKAPDPVHIRLLRPYAIVLPPDPVPGGSHQTTLANRHAQAPNLAKCVAPYQGTGVPSAESLQVSCRQPSQWQVGPSGIVLYL